MALRERYNRGRGGERAEERAEGGAGSASEEKREGEHEFEPMSDIRGGGVEARHAEERIALLKRHEEERRDTHGRHRAEYRKMHDRHENEHAELSDRHEREMGEGAEEQAEGGTGSKAEEKREGER